MHYLSWADHRIPLCFVKGLSYTKKSKVIEHRGGYISTRGFESGEISVQVEVSRAVCMAFSLHFDEQVAVIRELSADKSNVSGGVTIGGYVLYPELQFALTNINTSFAFDAAAGQNTYACDIVLSGVSCTKEVNRARVLEFEPEMAVPVVSLRCKGKRLILQDGNQVSRLETTPQACEMECILGDDSQTASRKGFIHDIIHEGGVVEIDLPQGLTTYNIVSASLVENVFYCFASIFPESSYQAVTRTYRDTDISDIVDDLLKLCGSEHHSIKISGAVDYYRCTTTPMAALEELQSSAGFVVSASGNALIVGWLPERIDAQKSLEGEVVEDLSRERISRVLWKDGLHEIEAGSGEGEALEVQSAFSSSDPSFASRVLAQRQYASSYVSLLSVLDPDIRHHSQVSVEKNNAVIPVLIDFYQLDWINYTARYDCNAVE